MASSYTGLGVELMVTGENAGTWGTKTNTNLNIIEQISGGYIEQAVNGTGATALTVTDGATGSAIATRVIKLTGTITANVTVNIPIDVENFYFIENGTSGAYTVEFEYASGSGSSVTWSGTDKGYKIINAKGNDNTNPDIVEIPLGSDGDVTLTGTQTLTNKTLTSPKIGTSILDTNGNELALLTATSSAVNEFTIANAASGNAPRLSSSGETNVDLDLLAKGTGHITVRGNTNAGVIQLNCESNSHGQQIKSQPHSTNTTNIMLLPEGADSTLVSRVSTDTLTNKTINASQLINATVSLAKLSNGTDGNLISYDANGAAVAVATGNAAQVLTSAGAGAPPVFADAAGGGTSWQTVKANSFTAAAGDGYFINTTNNVVTMTLPSSPTIGDEVSFVDYAGTFDSNQLTIGRNSQPIQGAASDLTVSIERAANTLVYVDGTQGWLLKNK